MMSLLGDIVVTVVGFATRGIGFAVDAAGRALVVTLFVLSSLIDVHVRGAASLRLHVSPTSVAWKPTVLLRPKNNKYLLVGTKTYWLSA